MVNQIEENKLEEEVAKVYESISLTVHQKIEEIMIENKRSNVNYQDLN